MKLHTYLVKTKKFSLHLIIGPTKIIKELLKDWKILIIEVISQCWNHWNHSNFLKIIEARSHHIWRQIVQVCIWVYYIGLGSTVSGLVRVGIWVNNAQKTYDIIFECSPRPGDHLLLKKMCPIFVGSHNNFGRSDGDMIKWKFSNRCRRGFMTNLHKKSLITSNLQAPLT